jgi:hypothetical protein
LARVTEALAHQGVNIRALAAVETADPVMALIVDKEGEAKTALSGLGMPFDEIDLLTVKVSDRPSELGKVARKLGDEHVNITSIYMLAKAGSEVELALSVSDLAKAKKLLGRWVT